MMVDPSGESAVAVLSWLVGAVTTIGGILFSVVGVTITLACMGAFILLFAGFVGLAIGYTLGWEPAIHAMNQIRAWTGSRDESNDEEPGGGRPSLIFEVDGDGAHLAGSEAPNAAAWMGIAPLSTNFRTNIQQAYLFHNGDARLDRANLMVNFALSGFTPNNTNTHWIPYTNNQLRLQSHPNVRLENCNGRGQVTVRAGNGQAWVNVRGTVRSGDRLVGHTRFVPVVSVTMGQSPREIPIPCGTRVNALPTAGNVQLCCSASPAHVMGTFGGFYFAFSLMANRMFFVQLPRYIWPLPADMHHTNQPFGTRAWDDNRHHGGIDMNHACGRTGRGNHLCGAQCAVPIFAVAGGVVQPTTWHDLYGNHVIIEHADGMRTLYAHLHTDSISVFEGERVSQGQRIATLGNTGNSDGPHLHFELRAPNGTRINPLAMYFSDDRRVNLQNPMPLFICTAPACRNGCRRGSNPLQIGGGLNLTPEGGLRGGHNFVFNPNFNLAWFNNSGNAQWWLP